MAEAGILQGAVTKVCVCASARGERQMGQMSRVSHGASSSEEALSTRAIWARRCVSCIWAIKRDLASSPGSAREVEVGGGKGTGMRVEEAAAGKIAAAGVRGPGKVVVTAGARERAEGGLKAGVRGGGGVAVEMGAREA